MVVERPRELRVRSSILRGESVEFLTYRQYGIDHHFEFGPDLFDDNIEVTACLVTLCGDLMLQTVVNFLNAAVDGLESPIDLLEPLIHAVEPLIDLREPLIHAVEPLIHLPLEVDDAHDDDATIV